MNVVIPSYKRADNLKGKDYFFMAKYCVPQSQMDEYKQVLGDERLICIPDDQDGNIVKKRNWILKNIPRPLVMIDDDVECIGYYENRKGQNDGNHRKKILPKEMINDFFVESFSMCQQFDFRMWGMSLNEDNRIYKEFLPFSLSKVSLGPFQGHLDHDIFFDEMMGTKEDYDMALNHLNQYRGIFRWNKFHYLCDHGDNQGGIVSFRTKEKETEYCKRIMIKWGKKIISYKIPATKMTDLLNAKKVNVPIKGV